MQTFVMNCTWFIDVTANNMLSEVTDTSSQQNLVRADNLKTNAVGTEA